MSSQPESEPPKLERLLESNSPPDVESLLLVSTKEATWYQAGSWTLPLPIFLFPPRIPFSPKTSGQIYRGSVNLIRHQMQVFICTNAIWDPSRIKATTYLYFSLLIKLCSTLPLTLLAVHPGHLDDQPAGILRSLRVNFPPYLLPWCQIRHTTV